MSNKWFAVMDMAIAGIPALAFGIWQYVSITREIARDRKRKENLPESQALPESARHPVGEHRLDDR